MSIRMDGSTGWSSGWIPAGYGDRNETGIKTYYYAMVNLLYCYTVHSI